MILLLDFRYLNESNGPKEIEIKHCMMMQCRKTLSASIRKLTTSSVKSNIIYRHYENMPIQIY